MPMYPRLKWLISDSAMRDFARQRLIALVKQLDAALPDKDVENNLLLATWNIRDLGKIDRRGYGKRLPDSFFYIAEIISRFDFVAVQEVNELDEWEIIMDILGPTWDYIATDVTDTKLGGNGERLTYVFDRRKVRFLNIAGEIVLPADMLISNHVVSPRARIPNCTPASSSVARPFAHRFRRDGSSSMCARCTSTTAPKAARNSTNEPMRSLGSPATWPSAPTAIWQRAGS